jgi:hypothetical protein
MSRTPLRIAATVELLTLVVLFANLCTVHWAAVSSSIGPTHGCAYLFVLLATARSPGTTARTTATALVPGIGGLLALRRLAAAADDRPRATWRAFPQRGGGGLRARKRG